MVGSVTENGSTTPPKSPSISAPPLLPDDRFTPEEETALVGESNALKKTANKLFAASSYSSAIQTYEKAIAACPSYLDYEVAVLRANIAACHLKLGEWTEVVAVAGQCLDGLERLDPVVKRVAGEGGIEAEAQVEEVDEQTAGRIEALEATGHSRTEVRRIRVKALMRRAKARGEIGGCAMLQGAEEDYKQLATMQELAELDRITVDRELGRLPARLEEATKTEMAEMMAKLKDLGNGILKPFGLSTENFNFVKDENSGGYSMQFNQNTKSNSRHI